MRISKQAGFFLSFLFGGAVSIGLLMLVFQITSRMAVPAQIGISASATLGLVIMLWLFDRLIEKTYMPPRGKK